MAEDAGEKTEEASEKRRDEFRERGDVARSRDIISVLILLASAAYFVALGPWIWDQFARFTTHFLDLRMHMDFTPESAMSLGSSSLLRMLIILAPLVGMVAFVSIFGNVAQVGLILTTKPLEPDFEKLNFFTRFIPTFFSKSALGNLVGSLLKIGVVGGIIWLTVNSDLPRIRSLSTLPLLAAIRFILERSLEMLINVTLVLVVISIADYFWSRYTTEEKMKMTRQEVKDEFKDQEGNPHVKGQMRKRARDIVNRKMASAVPTADVIVNNPTHLSIALRYRQGVDAAPIVVAKGADHMAMQIRKIAAAHNIPMVENVPLARMLYKHVKVGRIVPSQSYRAVAEVLAYVYRLRAQKPVKRAPMAGTAQVRRLDQANMDQFRRRNGNVG